MTAPTLGQAIVAAALIAGVQLDLFDAGEITSTPAEATLEATSKRPPVLPGPHLEYLLPEPVTSVSLDPLIATVQTAASVTTVVIRAVPVQLELF